MAVEHHPSHDEGTYLNGVSAGLIADTIIDLLGPEVGVSTETYYVRPTDIAKPVAVFKVYNAQATSKGDPGDPRTSSRERAKAS